MGRIKAKRLTEDQFLAAAVGDEVPDNARPLPAAATNRAVCHPSRKTFADGWCEKCYEKRRAMAPQELDGKVENELSTLVKGNQELEKVWRESKRVLENNLKVYAELHMEAAKRAAAKGDSRPIEWALTHILGHEGKTVVPEPEQTSDKGGGVKVLINIPLGGLPTEPIDVTPKKS